MSETVISIIASKSYKAAIMYNSRHVIYLHQGLANMSRWKPNARSRLEQAALELFAERGFEQTTVAEIADRAGLTERTFYRHFADKREVLFWGQGLLQEAYENTISSMPASVAPMDAVAAALEAIAKLLEERRERAQQRQ